MMKLIAIALGGALGSLGRYLVVQAVGQRLSVSLMSFPIGTLLVNAVGSFMIGLIFVLLQDRFAGQQTQEILRSFVIVGLLGGFTTFSAFSLETLQLLQYGLWGKAMLNIIGSLTICILAAFAGMALGRWIA